MIGKDPHFLLGCIFCHKGNDRSDTKEVAHRGLVVKPSDNLKTCGMCHKNIADKYSKSLHYTSAGQREGVKPRFSAAEFKTFNKKVFNQSCRSCHATCGDCHVKSPTISGISLGLIKGHKFVKKDEGKTCAFCHGGRVYPEYTGDYGGTPDVHYQKGMMCMDCHKKREMHGDGKRYKTKQDVRDRPRCSACHKTKGNEVAHAGHKDKVTCQGCHSSGQYRQCTSCHLGPGSTGKTDFYLGLNPRDKKTLTTLRLVPTVRDTFHKVGLGMANYDSLPNYWNSPVHNIKKRTARTRSCDSCHTEKQGFLKMEQLIKDGSKANEGLIYNLKPINE